MESIWGLKPQKRRDSGYQCYAKLQSLIRLAGDTDAPYETVPASDPRPKHVHLKHKLVDAGEGRTWRILPPAAATVAAVSDEAPAPPPEDVDVVAPPVAEMAIEAMPEEQAAAAEEPEARSRPPRRRRHGAGGRVRRGDAHGAAEARARGERR